MKKARKAKLLADSSPARRLGKSALAKELFELATYAQSRGWTAEELLTNEIKRHELQLRRQEKSGQ